MAALSRRFRRRRLLAGGALTVGLAVCGRASAQAALERHTAPGPLAPAAPQLAPSGPPPDQDARPLGADLTAVVLLGAEDAAAPGAEGVDARRMALRDRADLERSLARFLGQPLSLKLISEIEAAVVRHYRRVGRPFVSVTAPPQELTGGVLNVRVIEFRLGRKAAFGASAGDDKAILAAVRVAPGDLIDAAKLGQDLDWLNRSPFRQVTVSFAPGAGPGETDLQLQAHTARAWQITAGYANDGAPSDGLDRWRLGAEVGDIGAPGSLISYQLTTSGDFWFKDGALFGGAAHPTYASHSLVVATPLAPRQDLTVTAGYIESSAPVQAFDVASRTAEITAVYRAALSNLFPLPGDASLGIEARAQRTSVFFGAAKATGSAVDVFQIVAGWSANWADAWSRQSLSLTAHVSPGDVLAHNGAADFAAASHGRATAAAYSYYDVDYDGDFTISGRWRYVTAIRLQIADRPLIDTEQFAVGGDGGSRTYVYDDQSFDSGAIWRNEVHGPAWRSLLPGSAAVQASAYAFFDGAYGQDMRGGPRQFASSTGMGLDWLLGAHLSGGVAGGWSLVDGAYTRAGRFKLIATLSAAF